MERDTERRLMKLSAYLKKAIAGMLEMLRGARNAGTRPAVPP